jgi:hypothetical protein
MIFKVLRMTGDPLWDEIEERKALARHRMDLAEEAAYEWARKERERREREEEEKQVI